MSSVAARVYFHLKLHPNGLTSGELRFKMPGEDDRAISTALWHYSIKIEPPLFIRTKVSERSWRYTVNPVAKPPREWEDELLREELRPAAEPPKATAAPTVKPPTRATYVPFCIGCGQDALPGKDHCAKHKPSADNAAPQEAGSAVRPGTEGALPAPLSFPPVAAAPTAVARVEKTAPATTRPLPELGRRQSLYNAALDELYAQRAAIDLAIQGLEQLANEEQQ